MNRNKLQPMGKNPMGKFLESCNVQSCAYHCDTENYCSLDRIMVGTHEANPTEDQCTDCKSFRKR